MNADVQLRIARLEAGNRRLRLLLTFLAIPLASLAMIGGVSMARGTPPIQAPDSLRLRTLIIVDDKGVERVRLGGSLPDAVISGRRVRRGEEAAGVLLYDDSGQERSGYVTFAPSGNVALTLDTRKEQVALFSADPNDGAVARLWRNNDWVEMRTGGDGTRFSAGQDRRLVFQQPPLTTSEAAAGCAELKAEVKELKPPPPMAQLLDACMLRLPGTVCRRCLGVK